MKRLTLILLVLFVGAGFALAVDPPSEPIKVTNYGDKQAVMYPHTVHIQQGMECTKCHHKADEGKYKCGDCHGAEANGDIPKIKDAMHKKGIGKCYECHLDKAAVAKKKCGDCHTE